MRKGTHNEGLGKVCGFKLVDPRFYDRAKERCRRSLAARNGLHVCRMLCFAPALWPIQRLPRHGSPRQALAILVLHSTYTGGIAQHGRVSGHSTDVATEQSAVE